MAAERQGQELVLRRGLRASEARAALVEQAFADALQVHASSGEVAVEGAPSAGMAPSLGTGAAPAALPPLPPPPAPSPYLTPGNAGAATPPWRSSGKMAMVEKARQSAQPGLRAVREAMRFRDLSYPHHKVDAATTRSSAEDDLRTPRTAAVHVPALKKLAYALPEFSKLSVTMLMNVHAIAFFNEFGAHLSVLSFFIALARSFDVLTDPLMGWISDSTRSRFGRRRIYMAMFAPFYAGCLIALMSVVEVFRHQDGQGARETGIIAWFGCFYVLFYLFDTGANVPHGALGPELTDSQEERNRVFFCVGGFKMLGILFAAMMPVYVQYYFSMSVFGCYEDDKLHDTSWPPCVLLSKGLGLQYTSFFLATWYVVTIALACVVITERPASVETLTPPLVPSLMAMFRNKPFMSLLPAWVLDQLSVTMVTTMLFYFYTYIVQPQMTLECHPECTQDDAGAAWYAAQPDRDARGQSTKSLVFPGCRSSFWCGTSGWIGLSIVVLILAAVLSQPIWLWMTTRMEKRNVWLLYNVVNAITNIMFILVDEGNPVLCVVFVFFNGMPLGAQFLMDSIVADVIDYDEFLTGVRSEGRFTIGQSLLPKIVSVPAATIPLTLLVFLGFNPPNEKGQPQPQHATVTLFIKVVFFGIPFICCVLSALIKTRFPLRTEAMRRQVREGCALHMQGLPAVDPLSERVVQPIEFQEHEQHEQWRLDHFFLFQLEQLYMRGPRPLIAHMRLNRALFSGALFCFATLCATGMALGWIYAQRLAWICTFSAMGGGLSLCFLLLAEARLRAALSLQYRPVNKAFLGRLISLYQGDTNVESLSGITTEHVNAALQRWKVTNVARNREVTLASGERVPLIECMDAVADGIKGLELPVVDAESATTRATKQWITPSNAAVLKRVVNSIAAASAPVGPDGTGAGTQPRGTVTLPAGGGGGAASKAAEGSGSSRRRASPSPPTFRGCDNQPMATHATAPCTASELESTAGMWAKDSGAGTTST